MMDLTMFYQLPIFIIYFEIKLGTPMWEKLWGFHLGRLHGKFF